MISARTKEALMAAKTRRRKQARRASAEADAAD
jgi:hypothetical protein